MASNRPWLVFYAIFVHGAHHPLRKHLEKIIPKFDPNNDVLLEDHIKQFMISLRLMNVGNEDVVCRLFSDVFVGKESMQFFSLIARSIRYWKQFETTFLTQFGDDKTPRVLFLDISRIKINKREKIKYFNQRFITLLN